MIALAEIQNTEELEQIKETIQEVQNIDSEQIKGFFQETILPNLITIGIKIALIIVIYLIGTKLIKLIRKIMRRSLERAEADVGLMQFLDSVLKTGLYVLLIFGLISTFANTGISLAAIIGSAGLAIGLALQGSLSNFTGGILILLLKPFTVGDYIIEDTNKNEGTVKEIQVFYTKLITPDNKIVVIPNGTLSNSSLTNVTDQGKRRLDLFIGIGYQSDLKLAKQIILDILNEEEPILKDQDIQVFVDALEDSSIKIGLRAWVRTENFMTTKWKVLEHIKLAFDEHGIEIPYNQLDVTIKK